MTLSFKNHSYKRMTDAVTGETLNISQTKSATKGGGFGRTKKTGC
ncbi:hypothetical protein [Runella slithyformis]|nr:hypothetical protein [Runella slithyformis]